VIGRDSKRERKGGGKGSHTTLHSILTRKQKRETLVTDCHRRPCGCANIQKEDRKQARIRDNLFTKDKKTPPNNNA
jgi:hypothetical protein